jgi:hypothetical protein
MSCRKTETHVELRLAFSWTCHECGRDNFVNGIQPEYDPVLDFQMRDSLAVGAEQEGQFLAAPKKVTCGYCTHKFETLDPNSGEDLCDI